jgi:serine/threonine protein kinase
MQQSDSCLGRAPCQVLPGTKLGSCEVLFEIARGGMAQVWAACQHGARGFNRLVALKTVLPELAEPEFEEMFLEEARLAARIHHPNVCEIFELVEGGGVLALAMEWIYGETLQTLLETARGNLDRRVSAQIVAQIASGLHAAHELRDECGVPLRIVHRDVSPHNVMISRDGQVKVTDFGVAKAIGGAREETAAGQIKGKPGYMSPEQARCEPLDRRSDIFSLGVVLYVASVGAHPFRKRGQSRREQVLNLLTNQATPPSAIVPDYPKPLEAIVLKALQHDPEDRFSSANEMRRELCDWIMKSGEPVTENEISRTLLAHLGPTIEQRAERVAHALRAGRQRQGTSTTSAVLGVESGTNARAATALPDTNLPRREERTLELTLSPTWGDAVRQRVTRAGLRVALPVVVSGGLLGAVLMYEASAYPVSTGSSPWPALDRRSGASASESPVLPGTPAPLARDVGRQAEDARDVAGAQAAGARHAATPPASPEKTAAADGSGARRSTPQVSRAPSIERPASVSARARGTGQRAQSPPGEAGDTTKRRPPPDSAVQGPREMEL